MLIIHLSNKWTADRPPPTCEVALPFAATVRATNGSLVCTGCTQFTDCAIGRRTQVYVVTQQTKAAVVAQGSLQLDDHSRQHAPLKYKSQWACWQLSQPCYWCSRMVRSAFSHRLYAITLYNSHHI